MSQSPAPNPHNLLAAIQSFLFPAPPAPRPYDPYNPDPGTISDARADFYRTSSRDDAQIHSAISGALQNVHDAPTPFSKFMAGFAATLDLPNTLGLEGVVAGARAHANGRAARDITIRPRPTGPRSAATNTLFREMLRRGVNPTTAHDVLTQPNPYASAGAAIDAARASNLPPEPPQPGKPAFLRERNFRTAADRWVAANRKGVIDPPPKTFPLFTDPTKRGLDFADPFVQKGGSAPRQAAIGRTRPAIREGATEPLRPGDLPQRAIRSQDSHPESAKPPWSEQTAAFMQNSFYDEYTTTDPTTGERISRLGADGTAAAYRVPPAESREGNLYNPARFPVRHHILPDGSQVFDAAANPAVQHSINMQAEQGQAQSLNLEVPLPPDLARTLSLRSTNSAALAKGWSDLTTRLQRDPLFGDRLRSKLDATPAEWSAIMAARKAGTLPHVRAGLLMDLLSAILPGHDAGLQTMRALGYTSGYGLHTRRSMGQPATRRPIIRSWPAKAE